MKNVTIGHDAEVFVKDASGNVQSAIGLIGGSKAHPLKVHLGALQEDNVLAELNINPSRSFEEFLNSTTAVMQQLEAMLPAGWGTDIKSSHNFEKKELMSFGSKAMEFGCDPDFNCWTNRANIIASPYTTLRTAGGHIHIGHDNSMTSPMVARTADYLLGLPSVLLDDDTKRRALYGKAGAYRPKSYGTEYRVLSNFWLKDEDIMRFIYNQAVTCVVDSDLYTMMKVVAPEKIVTAINNSDKDLAAMYCRQLGIKV